MTISLSSRWEAFVAKQVKAGHFTSEREVVEASLSLLQRRDAELASLRATLEASLAEGGEYTADDIEREVAVMEQALRAPAG